MNRQNRMGVLALTGGCRRTFISLISILGLFVFGFLQDIDISNTVASIAVALAAANGTEAVFIKERKQKKEKQGEDQLV